MYISTTGVDRLQENLLIALISTSAGAWIASPAFQDDMMIAMAKPYSTLSSSLFAAVWTAGMAAMMLPAISPVNLLYGKLVKNSSTTLVVEGGKGPNLVKMVLFVGCYLAVWALIGLTLLLSWSLLLNGAVAATGLLSVIY